MEAYYPLLEALGALCWEAGGGVASIELLATHAPTWLVQFPAFMTRAHRDMLQREFQGATRERMLRELAELLGGAHGGSAAPAGPGGSPAGRPRHGRSAGGPGVLPGARPVAGGGTYRSVDLAMEQHPLAGADAGTAGALAKHELAVEPLSDADVAAYLAAAAA